jgi:hypothetical protein
MLNVFFLTDALFLLDGGRRRKGKKKEKKKIILGVEGFPRTGWAILTAKWVTAVKCN